MAKTLGVCCWCGLVIFASVGRCTAANPLFEVLTRRGVKIAPGEVLQLPVPWMADGLSAEEQRKIIESLPDNRHSWEALTRRTAVAPFVLSIAKPGPGVRFGRRVELAFILYADLETVGSDEFLNAQLTNAETASDPENGVVLKLLSDAELSRRRLPIPRKPEDPRVVAGRFTLLDRVRLSGATLHVKTRTTDSLLLASMFDERFADDSEFPNSWRPITRDESGRRRIGEPLPYGGFGGYAKITRLTQPAGALFVEYHIVFAEPGGWFNGTNLLRSKLPIAAQELVRDLRRRLDKSP